MQHFDAVQSSDVVAQELDEVEPVLEDEEEDDEPALLPDVPLLPAMSTSMQEVNTSSVHLHTHNQRRVAPPEGKLSGIFT